MFSDHLFWGLCGCVHGGYLALHVAGSSCLCIWLACRVCGVYKAVQEPAHEALAAACAFGLCSRTIMQANTTRAILCASVD